MRYRLTTMGAFGLLATGTMPATLAHAGVLMQASSRTQCLDVTSGLAKLATCATSPGQTIFNGNGQQKYGTLCLQGTGGNNATNTLALRPCNGSPDQSWAIYANGNFKNAGGWCAAATRTGTVIAAQCYGGGSYAWSTGNLGKLAAQTATVQKTLLQHPAGAAVNSVGALVAKGGTSLIPPDAAVVAGNAPPPPPPPPSTQSGGNIVAQGGGNIVAQGGGNIIGTTGGSIVAQGGGN